jgi:hypothetical protein
MDKKFYTHLKAFLISHKTVEDPKKNLAKIRIISNTNPKDWDGKLPTQGIDLESGVCRVIESTKRRPAVPWAWYEKEREPVPPVVKDIYRGLTFDFAVVFPQNKAWIYVDVEPSQKTLELLSDQEHLKAFILVSLVNERLDRAQREHQRLRLGTVMGSGDLNKIFTFVAFKEGDKRYHGIPRSIPTITRLVHPTSNTANWNIRLSGDKQVYGSFKEII